MTLPKVIRQEFSTRKAAKEAYDQVKGRSRMAYITKEPRWVLRYHK